MPASDMETSPSIAAAVHFIDVVWSGEAPTDVELLAALDRLLAAYAATPETGAADTDLEPPSLDKEALSEQVVSRFPAYGFYPAADPTASFGEAELAGDAIDDLCDMTSDMREVVWRAENIGLDDAHWFFRLLYFHWGRHARYLALYLHARQFG